MRRCYPGNITRQTREKKVTMNCYLNAAEKTNTYEANFDAVEGGFNA